VTALRRSLAFARFEAARALRSRGLLLAAAVFLLVHATGRWLVDGDDHLFGVGFLLAFAVACRPALSEDRERFFDRLLLLHLLSPVEYAVGKTIATVAWTSTFAAASFAVALLVGRGDLLFAGWYALLFLLLALAALPFVFSIDVVLATRVPAAVFLLLTMVTLFAAVAVGTDPERIQAVLGLRSSRYHFETLVPLLVRALAALATVPVVVLAGLRLRSRRGWGSAAEP